MVQHCIIIRDTTSELKYCRDESSVNAPFVFLETPHAVMGVARTFKFLWMLHFDTLSVSKGKKCHVEEVSIT